MVYCFIARFVLKGRETVFNFNFKDHRREIKLKLSTNQQNSKKKLIHSNIWSLDEIFKFYL